MTATVTISLPAPPPTPDGYVLREVYVVGRGSYPDNATFIVDGVLGGISTALMLGVEYMTTIGTKRSNLRVYAERDGDDEARPFEMVCEWMTERKQWMPWRVA